MLLVLAARARAANSCADDLTPPLTIDISNAIPAGAFPAPLYEPRWAVLSPAVPLTIENGAVVALDAEAYLRQNEIQRLPTLMLSNLRVRRTNQIVGQVGFLAGRMVVVQEELPLDAESQRVRTAAIFSLIAQVNLRKVDLALPILGYVLSPRGIRLVRPMVAGTALFPNFRHAQSMIAGPGEVRRYARFGTEDLDRFEHFVTQFEQHSGDFLLVMAPKANSPNGPIPEAFVLAFMSFNRVLVLHNKFVVEDLNLARVAELGPTDSEADVQADIRVAGEGGLNGFSTGAWWRLLMQNNIYGDANEFYRTLLWTHNPQRLYELDRLNIYLAHSAYRRLKTRENRNFDAIATIYGNVYYDGLRPFTRPTQFGFSNKKLKYHFKKHGPEMNIPTIDLYLQSAIDFILAPPTNLRIYVVRPNGDIALYDKRSNEFAVFTPIGVIRTYLHPEPSLHGKGRDNAIFPLIDLYDSWREDNGLNADLGPWREESRVSGPSMQILQRPDSHR